MRLCRAKTGGHQHRGAGGWGWRKVGVGLEFQVPWMEAWAEGSWDSRLRASPLTKSEKGPGEASRGSRDRLTRWCSWEDCER